MMGSTTTQHNLRMLKSQFSVALLKTQIVQKAVFKYRRKQNAVDVNPLFNIAEVSIFVCQVELNFGIVCNAMSKFLQYVCGFLRHWRTQFAKKITFSNLNTPTQSKDIANINWTE